MIARDVVAKEVCCAGDCINADSPGPLLCFGLRHAANRADRILSTLAAAGYAVVPVEQGWQPIETAPRDGRRILAWITHRVSDNGKKVDIPTIVSWWGPDADCWVEDGYDTVRPTHWLPLPAAPEARHD